ncbi:MAG: DUF1294 domain-containing protein [Tissierellia bacterium]|nr:DUF1294 domain-containing protein [Tissierellia bacterium]
MLEWIIIYYALINGLTLFLFWQDKRRAQKHKFRRSEKTLITGILAGGSPAALFAMSQLRHKNRKLKFRWVTILALIFHGVLLYIYYREGL